jgi:hypothetical protein
MPMASVKEKVVCLVLEHDQRAPAVKMRDKARDQRDVRLNDKARDKARDQRDVELGIAGAG